VGSQLLDNHRYRFRVWAPRAASVDLIVLGPPERAIPMECDSDGYFSVEVDDVASGTLYSIKPSLALGLPADSTIKN